MPSGKAPILHEVNFIADAMERFLKENLKQFSHTWHNNKAEFVAKLNISVPLIFGQKNCCLARTFKLGLVVACYPLRYLSNYNKVG